MKSLVALCLLFASPVMAQSLKVIKVKGSQAIVNVNGGDVSVGQVIKIPAAGETGDEELELTGGSTGPRRHLIGIDVATLQSGKDNSVGSTNSTSLAVQGRYGWNTGRMEYGAIGILGYQDLGGGAGTSTTFGAGGYFDFNFTPNKTGNNQIFGAGIEASYSSSSAANGGAATTVMPIYPSVFMKWFILKTPTALRLDLGYSHKETNSGTKITSDYVVGKAGFAVYF